MSPGLHALTAQEPVQELPAGIDKKMNAATATRIIEKTAYLIQAFFEVVVVSIVQLEFSNEYNKLSCKMIGQKRKKGFNRVGYFHFWSLQGAAPFLDFVEPCASHRQTKLWLRKRQTK